MSARVEFAAGVEPARQEWFLVGTETAVIRSKTAAQSQPRIAYPATGAVIALDPDIPEARQRVVFRMQPANTAYRWRLDGRYLPTPVSVAVWAPRAGRHQVALIDSTGTLADKAEFEVRGSDRARRQ